MNEIRWVVPLAPLFLTLLGGCPVVGGCDSDKFYSMETVKLTPEEYAEWAQGGPVAEMTTDPTATSGGTTGDGTTGAMTTSGGTTSGETTSEAVTTSGGTTSEPTTDGIALTEEEICTAVCEHHHEGRDLHECTTAASATEVKITCTFVQECVGGRRYAGVRSHGDAAGPGPVARWLARAAHDEAASVAAFQALGRELAAAGAPSELLAQVEAAADDEVDHAATTAALARQHGATVTTPVCAEVPARDLRALALENAVEGCVVETWAALSAAHQARFAADPKIRAAYQKIAADEARHAELAWAIDAWLCSQLDAGARVAVVAARRAAARELVGQLQRGDEAPALRALGLPSPRVASHLCAELDAALWSQAA